MEVIPPEFHTTIFGVKELKFLDYHKQLIHSVIFNTKPDHDTQSDRNMNGQRQREML